MARLEFHPVTPERLDDLARFSEGHGKFRYCPCMRWRLRSNEYQRSTKQGRVVALAELVRRGTPVGVLAYRDGEKALPRLDAKPVWAVVCFFVDRRERGEGVTLGGSPATFGKAGFRDVTPRGQTRAVMRRILTAR